MEIRYLTHKNIDTVRWDEAVSRHYNGCIYAYSWFLDRMCDNWDALVEDDYQSIMPLPWTEKYGQKIIVQPLLLRYLGIFTNSLSTPQLMDRFIAAIPLEYPYVALQFNKHNLIQQIPDIYKKSESYFSIMELMSGYQKISRLYQSKVVEALDACHSQKYVVLSGLQPRELIAFYTKGKVKSSDKLDEKNIRRFRSIVSHSLFHNFGEILGAYDNYNNLVATAFLLISHQRTHVHFVCLSEEHANNYPIYLMLDHYIRKNSEKNILLCFDATENKEFAQIFEDMGGQRFSVDKIKRNNLPVWRKILSRY